MQAIILAAGMGKRLGKLTQNNTKCMVEVNGEKLIDRVLGQLSKLDLRRVVIVVGFQGKKLVDYIGNRYDGRLKIEYIENPIYDQTNNIYSLALAKEKLQEDDTLLLESDLIFEDSLFDLILKDPYPNLALVSKYETWMDGTMVTLDADNNIGSFIPKSAFRYEDIDVYYKTVNIYKLSKEFTREQYVPFLDAYCKAMGNNEYYEQVLRVLTILDRSGLKALPIGNRKWYEIDDIQDLDIAETIFAGDDGKLAKFSSRYGGYWRFPQMLDFCYLVNPYFPPKRMKDEMRSNFDVLLTQYPSGMGVNSLLAAKYFGLRQEYVAVGNGAAELIKSLMENFSIGKVGVTLPTFEEYPNRLGADEVVSFTPKNDDFRYTADDLKRFFADKGISTLLIVNPDNPSGNMLRMDELEDLCRWTREKRIRLVIDESFVDFSDGFRNNSLLHTDVLDAWPHLVVMKSISKSYGVPGLRLGVMASSDRDLVSAMKKDVAIWNINSFAEYYMQIFSKYDNCYMRACDQINEERGIFQKELGSVAWLRVIPSQANYFLCEVMVPGGAKSLAKRLLIDFNILIKDCSSKKAFNGRDYVRIAVRDRDDNHRLCEALKSINPETL